MRAVRGDRRCGHADAEVITLRDLAQGSDVQA